MSIRRLPGSVDARIGTMAERVVRRISRRDALRGAVIGGTASVAALVLGQRPASAATCRCGPTVRCADCPGVGCPTGYSLCKGSLTGSCFNNQGYRCIYPHGEWIACTGLGSGFGYRVCYDCIGKAGCSGWCTCQSECICCDCDTARDVRAEQHRLQAIDVR
jgi:hypothetical protein